jgi:hypothetical protein
MNITAGRQEEQLCWPEPWTRFSARTGDLTAQDRDLMPQYHDLRVFGDAAAGEQRQPAEQPEQEQIDQAEEHECRG